MFNINNPFLSINFELQLMFLIIAAPPIINVFVNEDLKKFFIKNRIAKFIALFLVVYVSSSFYNDYLSNILDVNHMFWCLFITFLFILINKLHHKYIVYFLSITILLYLSIKVYNTYEKYLTKK